MFKRIFNKKKNRARIYKDDTFIVSFPKSGNTWVRFILANLIYSKEEKITFHTAKKFIPDYEVHLEDLKKLKRPRIIKSHSDFNSKFNKVIYILRDVRDVYISYYHYKKKQLPDNTTLNSYIRTKEDNNKGWNYHVNSWIKNKSSNILIIKYEDLLDDTFGEIKKVVDFMSLSYSDEQISEAISKSTFESMKLIEKDYGRPFLTKEAKEKSTQFVRKGEKEQWKNVLCPSDNDYLIKLNKELMELFNYI